MTEKNPGPAMKALLTGLLVGGCAIAALTSTGCERALYEQVAAASPDAAGDTLDLLGLADKPNAQAKLAANHNETFLVVDAA